MLTKINGIHIGYDDLGQGPAVVFLHDFALNRQMWAPQLESLLEAGFRVIIPDLRGFGDSETGSGTISIQTYSSDIIALLKHLGVGRAVVCGLSFGGAILFDLMENYPQTIAGACLVASRPVADDVQERGRRAQLLNALQKGEGDWVKWKLHTMLFSRREKETATKIRTAAKRWIDHCDEKALEAGLYAQLYRKDYSFLLKNINIPTLLIGAENDPITHHGHTDIMAQHLPNCYRAVKLSSGHLINLEESDQFNVHLLDFLQNLALKNSRRIPLKAAV
jgi:pimeloyl-ACP methyl ester carboxylesterase